MQTHILGLLTPLMALFFAATFAISWRVGRLRRHVLGFAIGYFCFACGFLVTHLLPGDGIYVFHTTQAFYTLGTVFFLGSLCDRVGQRLHLGSIVAIYGLSAAVLAIAMAMTSDAGPRLILINMGYGAMFMVGLTTLLQARRRDWIDFAIIAVLAMQAADFFIRPTLSVAYEQTIPAAAYQQSVYYSLIGLVLGVKSIAVAMVLFGATIVEWTSSVRESGARDPLTDLLNRGAFEQRMQGLITRSISEARSLSLVVADIDHFKQVNDIWGHQAGDRAISEFGALLETMIRSCDVAARIGGEEFCIAVWDCEVGPAGRLADRIRQAFFGMKHAGISEDVRLTASFGVAQAQNGESYEALFKRADAALYKAKRAGRDRVVLAEPEARVAPSNAKSSQGRKTAEKDRGVQEVDVFALNQRAAERA